MRIADSTKFMNTNTAMNKNRSEMNDLQSQAASQKRINKPSDDPVGSTKLLSVKTEEKINKQHQRTLDQAKSFMDFTDQALAEVTESLMRAKDLALSQANDPSTGEQTRKAVATEIRQLYNQALQVANRKVGNRFIFGGFNTTSKPFMSDGEYKGDRGEMMVEVDKGHFVSLNLPGDVVFLGRDAKRAGVLNFVPEDQSQLESLQEKDIKEKKRSQDESLGSIRGPASSVPEDEAGEYRVFFEGENIFKVLSDLETGLIANDKGAVQDSIDRLDSSLDQIVHARAKVGSRVQNLDALMEALTKTEVDNVSTKSRIEDVDAYELFSKLSQNESTLQSVMATSAKILQPSLLDFLR